MENYSKFVILTKNPDNTTLELVTHIDNNSKTLTLYCKYFIYNLLHLICF